MEVTKHLSELIPLLSPYPIWVKVVATIWAVVTALLIAGLIFARENNITNVVTQTAEIPVVSSENSTIEVFYPSQFQSTPHLTLQNNGYIDYSLLEQRPDGFKLKQGGYVVGAKLIWTAQGVLAK
jgi:hypothetical protein